MTAALAGGMCLRPPAAQGQATCSGGAVGAFATEPYPMPPELIGVDLLKQTKEEAAAKDGTCIQCHQGQKDPHFKKSLNIGCTDCHGGNPNTDPGCKSPDGTRLCPAAPPTKFPSVWGRGSANPVRGYTILNHESPEFIRFVNPGDLRVAHISCGTTNCHPKEVLQNRKSMMTHGCMLWGAALYNNAGVPHKKARYGEAYSMHGVPLQLQSNPPPTDYEIKHNKGVLAYLSPLPRYEAMQPSATSPIRIFERGGKIRQEIGIPETKADPGRPFLERLTNRGLGTENRQDPVWVSLSKSRLFDPTLNFMGTNDNPGDYRNGGCASCHVIYANDRSPVTSGPYAKYGHRGLASAEPIDQGDGVVVQPDPMIPKDEPGHPIGHFFAKGNSIPTSQCIICHIHPGTTVMNSYTGFMWWDEETDGELIFPAKQKYPTAEQFIASQLRNPNESAARNNLSDPEFTAKSVELNRSTKKYQFADYHGHGWLFRAVWKMDRKGNLLDHANNVIHDVTNEKLQAAMVPPMRGKNPGEPNEIKDGKRRAGVPVHLMDIHLEKGMHCIDCHFIQDNHGNTRLQQEVRAAVEIGCVDCHGTVEKVATLRTSGPAAYTSDPDPSKGRNLAALRTPWGKRRFEWRGQELWQNSMVEKDLAWRVVQVKDTIDPRDDNPDYNKKSALSKTVRFNDKGQFEWGDLPGGTDEKCAHRVGSMTCQSCHSSWNPSCYGCHLPQKANMKMPHVHWEGDVTRNYVSYNFQTLRDEVFMLAKDGDSTGNKINPARSSCAIHVTSYNNNREAIYYQNQTISGGGMAGTAFSVNVPHTVRGENDTKLCTDCHLSTKNDNNAIMAQLLMHGTGYLNWMGRYCWVGAGKEGFEGVIVTERDEPQAVLGSYQHKLAYPDYYKAFVEGRRGVGETPIPTRVMASKLAGGRLPGERELEAHEHPGYDIGERIFRPKLKNEVLNVQLRGEYLYAACGPAGVRLYDVSMTDHKGFSERFFTTPVSPIGQRFFVRTQYATYVAAPCTPVPDPTRMQMPENKEQAVAGVFAYIYVCDKFEGLILVGIATQIDGNPLNNYLKRETTFNPNGILCGAKYCKIIGNYAYVCCDKGLVVVDVSDAKKLEVKAVIGEEVLKKPRALDSQFRYCYVADEEGIKVLDITDLTKPKPVSKIAVPDVKNLYMARTYCYLAAGRLGLVILDIENPEVPKVDQVYNAHGEICDLHDVKLAITYASEFAYLADGKHGMHIVQLTSPETPGNMGYSPRPTPELIATRKLPYGGEAISITRALDRDRAVDESGNQISVFGRVGARPFNLAEQHKMYLRDGKVWKVSNDPDDEIYKAGYKKPGGGQ